MAAPVSEATAATAYDEADGPIWRLAVYEPVHEGWAFTSMGGRHVLDYLGSRASLTHRSSVLELCCGMGDTCRYLARTYGCRVSGIDINARQIQRARERASNEAPAVAERLSYRQADVRDWRPSLAVDAVLTLDSLMLVPDLASVLAAAHETLVPGGIAVFAEMVAGVNLTLADRDFAAREDGIINLPTPAEYRRLLRRAGFKDVEDADITPIAAKCFETIHCALRRRASEIVNAVGARAHAGWLNLAEAYTNRFRGGRFGYCRLTAVAR